MCGFSSGTDRAAPGAPPGCGRSRLRGRLERIREPPGRAFSAGRYFRGANVRASPGGRGKVVAAAVADGTTLPHDFPADRARAALRPGHEPDQAEEDEAEEADQQHQCHADPRSGIAGVLLELGLGVAAVLRAAAAGDRPDHDQGAPGDQHPGHLPPVGTNPPHVCCSFPVARCRGRASYSRAYR
jgi:hypothetical protein